MGVFRGGRGKVLTFLFSSDQYANMHNPKSYILKISVYYGNVAIVICANHKDQGLGIEHYYIQQMQHSLVVLFHLFIFIVFSHFEYAYLVCNKLLSKLFPLI